MKLLAGIGALGMLGGGLYASDALTAGTVYDKPYEQAYTELATMPLLPVTGATEGDSGSMVVERGAGTIGWRVSLANVELGRLTARLSPVGTDRTRVLLDFKASTPPEAGKEPILSSDLMRDFARLALVEQVDARLEDRAPDMQEIHMAAARHLQAHPEQVKQFGTAVQTQFRQVDEMLRADKSAEWKETMRDIKIRHAPPRNPADAARPTTVFPDS